MNYDDLVMEIVNRVNDKMSKMGECPMCNAGGGCMDGKPKLLIAAQEDCELCKELRTAPALNDKYQITESFSQHYIDDIDSFDAVVLFSMGISDLAKIASGAWDDAYTDTAVRAILRGKKVYLVKEAVELFGMMETAPDVYYDMLLRKLELLQKSGVVLLPYAQTLPALLGEPVSPEQQGVPAPAAIEAPLAAAPAKAERPAKEIKIDKRVITEKDLTQAKYDGASSVRVGERAIMTDLAKEYAQSQGLVVVRG